MLTENIHFFSPNNKKINFYQGNQSNIYQLMKNQVKKPSKKIVDLNILTKNYDQEKQTYQWRLKTQFPIVKILSYDLQSFDPNKNRSFLTKKVQAKIQIQDFPLTLTKLTQIPLFKILYLLKESLIGLQRLVNRFGFFKVTSDMIVINSQQKCNIWFNSNIASNQIQIQQTTEKGLIQSLIQQVQKKAAPSKQIISFFQYIKPFQKIIQLLSAIQNFAKINKTKIPTKFVMQAEKDQLKSFSPEKLKYQSSYNSPQKTKGNIFSANTSLNNKIPKFIQKFRSTMGKEIKKHFNSEELNKNQITINKNRLESSKQSPEVKMTKSQKRVPSFITMKDNIKKSKQMQIMLKETQNNCQYSNNQEEKLVKLVGIQQYEEEQYKQSNIIMELSTQENTLYQKQKMPVFQKNQSFLKELQTQSIIINQKNQIKTNVNIWQNTKNLESTIGATQNITLQWPQRMTTLFCGQQFNKSFHEQDQSYIQN